LIGQLELIIILVVVFLIFGAKRLPDIARSIGKGIREFRKALDGRDAGEEKGGEPPAAPDGNAPAAPGGKPDGKEG
jgi:sec-independent protein translocase protein TatA